MSRPSASHGEFHPRDVIEVLSSHTATDQSCHLVASRSVSRILYRVSPATTICLGPPLPMTSMRPTCGHRAGSSSAQVRERTLLALLRTGFT